MDPIRVLVTGAGSGVGQGIVKSLRVATLPVTVIGADIHPMNAALFRTDESVLIPKVEEEGALPKILDVLTKSRAKVLMIGSEFEVEFFATHKARIEKETGALVIVSPLESVQIADDKWLTAEFLRKNGLPYAEAYCPSDARDAASTARKWGFPLLLKTRSGTSNRHVHIVTAEAELLALYDKTPKPMLQQLIGMPSRDLSNEYTCSVFKCGDGTLIGPFTSRRVLRGGSSWLVEVAPFKELYPLLLEIGEKLPLLGSFNVQLMIGSKGPVPFEFNCRFSGTTAVRAHFGFNEPEMALRHYLLGERLTQPKIRTGLALRYLEEVFIEGVGAESLRVPLPKGEVRPWF